MGLLENTAKALETQLEGKKVDKLTKDEAIAILNAVLNAVKKDAAEHSDKIKKSSALQKVVEKLKTCTSGQDISNVWANTPWVKRKGAMTLAPTFVSDDDDKKTVGTLIAIMEKSL